jgi:hypothetical protein
VPTAATETAMNAVRALLDAVTSDAAANAATVAAVVFAFFSVERWRAEKRGERRGEAAAHALGTLLIFCDKLTDWMAVLETTSRPIAGPPSEEPAALVAEGERLLRTVRTAIEEHREALQEAARRGRAYLTQLELESLNVAYGVYRRISFQLDDQPELRAAGGGLPQDRFDKYLAECREYVERVRERGGARCDRSRATRTRRSCRASTLVCAGGTH